MSEEKKIIIDEDWKAQVEAEKEAFEQQAEGVQTGQSSEQDPRMPPASFQMLLTTLATEAMMALGQLPNPLTGEAAYRPNQAKYLIDTIEVLQDKTQGNVTPEEALAIKDLLHQLRMAFLAGPPEPKEQADSVAPESGVIFGADS